MKLHLVLTFHWFDEIAKGNKRVEYRENTPFWQKRVQGIKTVVFHRGYSPKTLAFPIKNIDIGPCEYPGWDGEYIRIHF